MGVSPSIYIVYCNAMLSCIRGRPKLLSFSREYTEYAGKGVNGHCMLLKIVDYDVLHFHTGPLKINIFKVLFWEGVAKKEYSVYIRF